MDEVGWSIEEGRLSNVSLQAQIMKDVQRFAKLMSS